MAENAAKAVRGMKLSLGSKMLPPPGLLTDGQAYWMRYCEASNAVNVKSVLTAIKEIEVDGVLSRGNGLGDHDHPTPRWFCKRSNASRKTFEGDKDRSMGES